MKKWNKNLTAFMGWTLPSFLGISALWPSSIKANLLDDSVNNLEESLVTQMSINGV